jgi:hypothetical protein
MKKGMMICWLLLPLFCSAQINCPAFGRLQNYENAELLFTWNTVDPYHQLAGIEIDDDAYTLGQYTDRSIAPGLTFNYYADNITLLRLKGIYTSRNVEHTAYQALDSLGNSTTSETTFSQTLFKVAPGFGWVYFVERFSFYGGFEVPYTHLGDLSATTLQTDSAVGAITTLNTETTIPGGFEIGLGCFAGSTFYFPQLLGIGFEISSAYQYSTLGGEIVSRTEVPVNPGQGTEVRFTDEKELWKFSPLQASLHLSLRF